MKKKRSFTLLEIMIVIFLIGIIGSVIGFNMKDSMDKGKVFKTEQAQRQIEDTLYLMLAEGTTTPEKINQSCNKIEDVLKDAGLLKKPDEIAKDGWGNHFVVSIDINNNTITVFSQQYENHKAKSKK